MATLLVTSAIESGSSEPLHATARFRRSLLSVYSVLFSDRGRRFFGFPAHSTHLVDMARRKSKRKPPPKKKMTGNLDTQFTCPFCNHEKSCDVKMERNRNTGIISCSVCLEEFQTPITYLSEPVDVYSDWIDACEAANQ
ncbi:hypothetical protein MHYP_G00155720 [Metynnis hypsauchen]